MNSTKAMPSATTQADEFVISRVVDAPRSRVWKAWTNAKELKKWWGPKGFEVVSTKVDLKPGGTFHYLLRSPNGQEMWGKFVYREIVPEERLVFISSFSTVTFAETAGKTTITVRWSSYEATQKERETFEAGRDSMKAGWTGTFERLDAYLGNA
jgi:uncharacterized protein YndB with AHSA1/START domain